MIRESLLVGANASELLAVYENELELPVDRSAGDWRRLPEKCREWRVDENRDKKTAKGLIVLPTIHDVGPGQWLAVAAQTKTTSLSQHSLSFSIIHSHFPPGRDRFTN